MPQKFSTLQYVVDGVFCLAVLGYTVKLMMSYKPKIHSMTVEEARNLLFQEIKDIPDISEVLIRGNGRDASIVVFFEKEPNLKEALKIPLSYHGFFIKTKIVKKTKNGKK